MHYNLPEAAYVENTIHARGDEGEPKLLYITRGEYGYSPIYTPLSADYLNARIGVTRAQAAAMLAGSMFGWHVPGANPNAYDENGNLK